MSNYKSPKKKILNKFENTNFPNNPDTFKYRSVTKIYPLYKQKINRKRVNNKSDSSQKEKKIDLFDLDEDFLFALVQPIFLLDKQKMNNTIANLILNSKLITKLENDKETNESINTLINKFIKNLTFRFYKSGSILFHNGEMDNKFYFVIKGKISSLKPKKMYLEISLDDYLLYLINLEQKQEKNILDKVLKLNVNYAPLKSIEDIKRLNTIIFKKRLEQIINTEEESYLIETNYDLQSFFNEYYQDYNSYNISRKELKKLMSYRGKLLLGVINREWDDYLLEHCKLTSDENSYFEQFEKLYKQKTFPFNCFKYEFDVEYINNDYFGDYSLDDEKTMREETLRFEEDTTIAWITIDEYIDIISPQKKIEKKNDIIRLNNSFCFKDISERIFKKNYYEMFTKKHFSRNTILFKPDTESNSIFFIKDGKLGLQLNCSIIGLHKLIQLIFDKLNNISPKFDIYQKKYLTKEHLKVLQFEYLNDPFLRNMKSLDKKFKLELEKERIFQIALFSDFEIVGLEEVYLRIPHFTKAIVLGDKFNFSELPLNKFNLILQREMRQIKESFVQISINKILSLIKRLYDIKQIYINMAKVKSDIDDKIFEKIPEEKNIEYSYNISNINKKLSINNNKTTIPQINYAKTIENDINDGGVKIEDNNSKIYDKKNNINLSQRKLILKSANYIKSPSKIRTNKLNFDINLNNRERAKSGKLNSKLEENLDEEEEPKKIKKKSSNIIIIGNKNININQLQLMNDNEEISNNSKIIKDNLNKRRNLNLIKSIELNYNIGKENLNRININREKFNTIKSRNSINKNLSNNFSENEKFKSRKDNISYFNIINNNKIINDYSNQMNFFIPISINPMYPKIFNNKKTSNLNLMTENNINDNENIIIKTSPNIPKIENSKIINLPKIELKINKNINNSLNSNTINANSNRFSSNGNISEKVKRYYSQIKQKGYIPLIVNKRFNTIFLRKYHKKYNEN